MELRSLTAAMEYGRCPAAEVGAANVGVVLPGGGSVTKALLSSLLLRTSPFPATLLAEPQETAVPAAAAVAIELGFRWVERKRCFLHSLRKKSHNW